jgi:dipeptidyl-peptidase 4
MIIRKFKLLFVCILLTAFFVANAQFQRNAIKWTKDGNGYYKLKEDGIVQIDIKTESEKTVVKKTQLAGIKGEISTFFFSDDHSKLLLFANTAKVWRYRTRGDYWLLDINKNKLSQLGKNLPAQSLMYAKFSPDNRMVGYVSEHNIYAEDVETGKITQLTFDGTRKLINGTFDWVYEEEFNCRDGFRWSPDGASVAFWQVDASRIGDYYMLNTIDSNYSKVIPVEYPKVGESPSAVKIGVVKLSTGNIRWMNIEGDPQQNYLVRMEWSDLNTLIIQQLNRKQQVSKLFYCDASTGNGKAFYTERNDSWIETKDYWNNDDPTGWEWIHNGKEFIWVSEKDGWRHLYKVSRDGKNETLLTTGKYDISSIESIDQENNLIYFTASPDNATQLYLFSVKMDGKNKAEMVSDRMLKGTNEYTVSPNAKWALHSFSNYKTPRVREWVNLAEYKKKNAESKQTKVAAEINNSGIYYTTITTEDGITVDAWVHQPTNFDSTKKYPLVLYVYGEPGMSTLEDSYGNQDNVYGLYDGNMSNDGYFQISVDNRGTPSLKGAGWRKAIYKQIGRLNIRDIALATKKIIDKPYIDKDRIAVWGWSGGGSSTLMLMFQYPEIFKTGISIAALDNLLFYDNVYEERYMGLPEENMQDYVDGSSIKYAKNLQGNLLLIHGTGDDNVHYSNAEIMIDELIKNNKQFQLMSYPNRTHSLSEGEGTRQHLSTLYTNYLKKYCPPGAR